MQGSTTPSLNGNPTPALEHTRNAEKERAALAKLSDERDEFLAEWEKSAREGSEVDGLDRDWDTPPSA